MRTCWLAILFTVALLVVAWPCAAQYDDNGGPVDWSIRAGAVFPRGNTVNTSELMLGIEVEDSDQSLSGNGSLTLTVDYIPMGTHRASDPAATTTVSLFPIMLNYKMRTQLRNQSVYLGAGIGFYYAQDPIPDMDLPDSRTFAWQAMAGVEFRKNLFVEGRYIAGKHPEDDGLLAAAIGYHF